jgi:hypothetical protein
VECLKEQAEEGLGSSGQVMVAGIDEIVNPGPDAEHPERTYMEVESRYSGGGTHD